MWSAVYSGRTIRQWYEVAKNQQQDKLSRDAVFDRLAQAGRPGAFALVELLRSPDEVTDGKFGHATESFYVRLHAVKALGGMGQEALPAGPYLASMLRNDKATDVRIQAAFALGTLHVTAPECIDALKKVLRSQDYDVWPAAVNALGRIRPYDQEAYQLVSDLAHLDLNRLTDSVHKLQVVNAKVEAGSALQGWNRGR